MVILNLSTSLPTYPLNLKWSIRRLTKFLPITSYLGDALVHLSFPVLLLGAGLLHPLAALGPLANYAFLRFVGGDRETEAHQEKRYAAENPAKLAQLREYRASKNSFWPAPAEAANRWTWIVIAAGTVGVVAERGVRALL